MNRWGEMNEAIRSAAGRKLPLGDTLRRTHTWVAETDGDTGADLGYAFCGGCGVWKCTGDCGDPDVGAAPDVDCPVHGNHIAKQCLGDFAGQRQKP